jgi:hypothetical protein
MRGRLPSDLLSIHRDRRQRRLDMRGRRQVAEAHHRDLTRDLDPARVRFIERSHRELVRCAEHRVEGRATE